MGKRILKKLAMNSSGIKKKSGRFYQIIEINNKKYFLKKYDDKNLDINRMLEKEYKIGKKLCKLINYPEPIKILNNQITYEFIDIKYNLSERINKGKFNYNHFQLVGKYLSKIHEHGIIHGDFNTENVVITKDKKIYFIDAIYTPSFEFNNSDRIKYSQNIYQDISRFLVFLKWNRPLYKPWLFFQIFKINQAKKAFLKSYFKNNIENLDNLENRRMQINVLKNYINFLPKTKFRNSNRLIWKLFFKLIILIMKFKNGKNNL